MHRLIDENMVASIRSTGNADAEMVNRIEILDEYRIPYDRKAENVIISGCQIPFLIPRALKMFAVILDRRDVSYTFLSKEYCCGNLLYRTAIRERDEEALAECRLLSKEFIDRNLRLTGELGAKRVVIFCSPCYPIFKHAFPEEEIIFYPELLDEVLPSMRWREAIDYYAGCYRLHKKLAPFPMDLRSTNAVFDKIEGLNVNRIGAPACCHTEQGLNHMLSNVRTGNMVHVCNGCYIRARDNMPAGKETDILLLPEFICKINNWTISDPA
ncbi:MAG: (Fe-S)-binding protein [Syntrophales bacterium]|nr:(Fe-S)-binding protein [Syntrophales bacterium]